MTAIQTTVSTVWNAISHGGLYRFKYNQDCGADGVECHKNGDYHGHDGDPDHDHYGMECNLHND